MHTTSKKFIEQNPHIAGRVEDCVEKIREAFDPEKIYLFGSYARGEAKEGTTMDFIIIAKSKLRFFDRIKKALIACRGGKPSIEPLVYTPREFELLLSQGEGFLEDALEESVELFNRTKDQ